MLNKLDPLEKLENWIVEKFSRIQNKNINPLISKEAPLRKGIELSVNKIINIIINKKNKYLKHERLDSTMTKCESTKKKFEQQLS